MDDGPGSNGSAPQLSSTQQLGASLRELLATVLDRAFGLALDKVEEMARSLDDIAARGGLKLSAVLGGVRASLGGQNPVWGAIRGAVGAMSTGAKIALFAVLVLALLLLPVTVVLLLLALIVVAVIAVARTRSVAH